MESVQLRNSSDEEKDDDGELKKLGYDAVLHRGLNEFSNFAFGFTEVAVLVSFTSQYSYGLQTGGIKFVVIFLPLRLIAYVSVMLCRSCNYILGVSCCVHYESSGLL